MSTLLFFLYCAACSSPYIPQYTLTIILPYMTQYPLNPSPISSLNQLKIISDSLIFMFYMTYVLEFNKTCLKTLLCTIFYSISWYIWDIFYIIIYPCYFTFYTSLRFIFPYTSISYSKSPPLFDKTPHPFLRLIICPFLFQKITPY